MVVVEIIEQELFRRHFIAGVARNESQQIDE